MNVRVYLTGRVGLEVNGELVIDERQFRARQDRLVFAYLVSRRATPVPRQELAVVVWPGEAPAAWEAALSALLSRLRALLATNGLSALGTTISRGFGQYQLHLPGDAWIDLEAVASAVDAAEGALRAGDPRRAFGPATVASTIARHPFLAGEEGGWIESQRRKLRRQLLRALDCLSEIWLSTGEPQLAVEAAAEAVGIDPVRESSHRLLMRAHAAAGNSAESMKIYHGLRELLAEELGTDPSAETEALYMELLS